MTVDETDSHRQPMRASRPLKLIPLAYLLMYPIPWFERPPTRAGVFASLAGLVVFLVLYFRGYGMPGWRRLWVAGTILVLGFCLAPFGGMWGVFVVYAASLNGFARPARIGITGVVGVLVATLLGGVALRLSPWDYGSALFFGTILGLSSIFIAASNEQQAELARTRDAARRFAVVAERERIARDLHDVLGHTLTLVAVKADLARRLLETDASGARREIEEIHAAARAALADVRRAVSGMRSTTLTEEVAEARRALDSAGIAFDSALPAEPLPPRIETALAYVIREAATNVIRHSGARHCRIRLTRVGEEAQLSIEDDGCGGLPREGNGFAGIRQRLEPLAGVLTVDAAKGMRLDVRVPLVEAA